jgi:hypothetical protein
MKVWVYINGKQRGPYTLDQLTKMDINPDTPVWHEGMTEWLPASEVPLVYAVLFSPEVNSEDEVPSQEGPASLKEWLVRRPAVAKSYIGWSVALTICCCGSPLSLAALVGSIVTIVRNNAGNERGARKASQITEWLVIIAITFGLIYLPLSLLVSGL